jgi:hypothetical protein
MYFIDLIDIYTPSELNQCLFKRRMFSSRARSASELILPMNKHSFNSRVLSNILFNSDVLNRIYQLHNNQGKQLFIR